MYEVVSSRYLSAFSWAPQTSVARLASFLSFLLLTAGGFAHSSFRTSFFSDRICLFACFLGSWIEAFYTQGLNVYAMDHQSHGHSAGWNGWRCNVEKFDHFVDDALLFLRSTVATDPLTPRDSPIYILGYSMGGNITLQTLCRVFSKDPRQQGEAESARKDGDGDARADLEELRDRVRGCVLLAPMLKILLDRKTRCLAKFNRSIISSCMPNLRLARGGASDEEYAYLDWWYEKDLYAYGGRTLSLVPVLPDEGLTRLDSPTTSIPYPSAIARGTLASLLERRGGKEGEGAVSFVSVPFSLGRDHSANFLSLSLAFLSCSLRRSLVILCIALGFLDVICCQSSSSSSFSLERQSRRRRGVRDRLE